ncbi:hypothetical protein DDB_G0281023 [Dictyostelium discoideum AX4]|uniref:Putative uncharacterized transmembrane protein DDB_G0281023 n=1 Tax=Dictyostelium discoideum TaxID=44689 RepID=Y3959_DICDI|nr:hypothetical protein DDB_G0281023 [Dictyostelium discoideum AX4]Q54UK4.1 RecName: Full=Putative uncharacterized transmembrane protein DDB_G0281023 [Dictyostelium discoideum]EAL66808.1 hypothetical protein DDB_G0281023 [Dictyostelium discoideum AX4]|eukprot:XP_640772.1 hypothetical protein DDB_G0281023 [Dictyostelium discoideum AX4]
MFKPDFKSRLLYFVLFVDIYGIFTNNIDKIVYKKVDCFKINIFIF